MDKQEIEKLKKELVKKVDELFDLLHVYNNQLNKLIGETKTASSKTEASKTKRTSTAKTTASKATRTSTAKAATKSTSKVKKLKK